jgi:hypothetical protein
MFSGFRGVKLEEVENVNLLVRAENPMYLLYTISMCRIFVVAQRSKDCLHPCRSSCLEVDMLLQVLLLLQCKVPAMVIIIYHDCPVLNAMRSPTTKERGRTRVL